MNKASTYITTETEKVSKHVKAITKIDAADKQNILQN